MFKDTDEGKTHSFGDGCVPPHPDPTTPVCEMCQGDKTVRVDRNNSIFNSDLVDIPCPSCSQPKEEAKGGWCEKCGGDHATERHWPIVDDVPTPPNPKSEDWEEKLDAKLNVLCGAWAEWQDGNSSDEYCAQRDKHVEFIRILIAEARREQWEANLGAIKKLEQEMLDAAGIKVFPEGSESPYVRYLRKVEPKPESRKEGVANDQERG